MRRRIFILILLAALLGATQLLPARSSSRLPVMAKTRISGSGPHKRALLVGISKYARGAKEPNKDWWDLNTGQDVTLLKETLIKKFQFEEKEIMALTLSQETTHKAIIDAFRAHLIAHTQPGDIIFFHFSGHGMQIPDDGVDEMDGMDESLVPSDYVSRTDGSKNIRDDELGALLDELKQKKPANVTVTLDSCFSGTATRGDFPPRGGDWKGAPVSKEKIRGEDTSASGLRDGAWAPADGYVFISAAGPRQTAKETKNEADQPMGLFTWALVKAMEASGPTTTYRDIFERLNDLMTRMRGDQNPQLEGELDKTLMAGTALKPERYIGVKVDERKNVFLRAGKLQGMTQRSKFAIFPEGSKSAREGTKLADAEVVKVDVTTSLLKLTTNVPEEKLRAARAFETEHFYDDAPLKVATENLEKLSAANDIRKQLKSFELLEIVNRGATAYDALIHPPGPKDVRDRIVTADFQGAILERQNGSIIATIAEGPEIASEIKQALEREIRWLTIKSLENTDTSIKVELRVVPVEVELNPVNQRVRRVLGDKNLTITAGNQMELAVGDHVMLEVRNIGDEPAYVTILNLRSDGLVGPAWPQTTSGIPAQVNDNFVKNDAVWRRLREPYVFRIVEPAGLESFRAIATREPTDFTPLIDDRLIRRGLETEKEKNAMKTTLGRILIAGRQGKRGDINMDIPPAWATATVSFNIRKN